MVPEEQVILVDADDRETGRMSKAEAHRVGALHRAFSVFLFDSRGRLLLQQRAAGKYHSPSLWTNTCCGHPRPGEALLDAARRRLKEEMGIECDLWRSGSLRYRCQFGEDLTENEFDHVLVGHHNGDPVLDPAEAGDFRWVDPARLAEEIALRPEAFSYWMPLALPRALAFRETAAANREPWTDQGP